MRSGRTRPRAAPRLPHVLAPQARKRDAHVEGGGSCHTEVDNARLQNEEGPPLCTCNTAFAFVPFRFLFSRAAGTARARDRAIDRAIERASSERAPPPFSLWSRSALHTPIAQPHALHRSLSNHTRTARPSLCGDENPSLAPPPPPPRAFPHPPRKTTRARGRELPPPRPSPSRAIEQCGGPVGPQTNDTQREQDKQTKNKRPARPPARARRGDDDR